MLLLLGLKRAYIHMKKLSKALSSKGEVLEGRKEAGRAGLGHKARRDRLDGVREEPDATATRPALIQPVRANACAALIPLLILTINCNHQSAMGIQGRAGRGGQAGRTHTPGKQREKGKEGQNETSTHIIEMEADRRGRRNKRGEMQAGERS